MMGLSVASRSCDGGGGHGAVAGDLDDLAVDGVAAQPGEQIDPEDDLGPPGRPFGRGIGAGCRCRAGGVVLDRLAGVARALVVSPGAVARFPQVTS